MSLFFFASIVFKTFSSSRNRTIKKNSGVPKAPDILAVLLACGMIFASGVASCLADPIRIVDFGSDLGWGEIFYRGESVNKTVNDSIDRDKNGTNANDWVSSWPFSLEKPLNMPGLRYDTDQKSAVFYGGLVLYSSNPAKPASPRAISEGHMNSNHEFRDDLNFMGGLAEHGKDEKVEAYATWLWQKKDFLNGGDKNKVIFDDHSQIVVHVSRYWGGLHAGRWMVRDGNQFYLSKATWGDSYKSFVFVKDGGKEVESASLNPIAHKSHILMPSKTEWAEYDPSAKLDFDHGKAVFKQHEFSDVTAVGFFISREQSPAQPVASSLRPPIAFKWNAFRCDAVVVDRPANQLVEMVSVPKADGSPAFLMSKGEITFRQWHEMMRISVTNQHCRDLGDLGYTFEKDGALGSMKADDFSHSPNEPVTEITWLDAAAYCNALSEMEGLLPAYYADAEHKIVLRRTVDRDIRENWRKHPVVYWKKDSPGYRLPTAEEWCSAAGEGKGNPVAVAGGWVKANAQGRTHESATSSPNAIGICDLIGNVWEFVWENGNSDVTDSVAKRTVYGGCYQFPDDPATSNLCHFAENPLQGSYSIGFRVVRNAGSTFVAAEKIAGDAPTWIIEKGKCIPSAAPLSLTQLVEYIKSNLQTVSLPVGLANECDEIPAEVIRAANNKISVAQNNHFLKKITTEEAEKIISEVKSTMKTDRPSSPYQIEFGKTEISYALWKRVKG